MYGIWLSSKLFRKERSLEVCDKLTPFEIMEKNLFLSYWNKGATLKFWNEKLKTGEKSVSRGKVSFQFHWQRALYSLDHIWHLNSMQYSRRVKFSHSGSWCCEVTARTRHDMTRHLRLQTFIAQVCIRSQRQIKVWQAKHQQVIFPCLS